MLPDRRSCQGEEGSSPFVQSGKGSQLAESTLTHPDLSLLSARDLCNGVDHGCEFQCVSEGFSYHCVCPEGRQLQADGKSCSRE